MFFTETIFERDDAMRLKSQCTRFSRPMCGFTLVELLVVISIIALLLAILMPALQKAREQGMAIVCRSNLKTLGLSEKLYAAAYNDRLVPMRLDPPNTYAYYWAAALWSHYNKVKLPSPTSLRTAQIEKPSFLYCPAEKKTSLASWNSGHTWGDVLFSNNKPWLANICYTANSSGQGWYQAGVVVVECMKSFNINRPSETVAAADGAACQFPGGSGPGGDINWPKRYTERRWSSNADGLNHPFGPAGDVAGEAMCVTYRHRQNRGLNVLLWDGHVSSVADSIFDNYNTNAVK
ncbi:MAG: hypothetical protein A2Y13_12855 [Planctomycetes bacterium GWC2_45_44]|nr:MAG: hypothetical protein A2Y13_12855 [Planctomycetes bacterium GWC2_45_44]HBR19823.1 hypothetical protein [Phycisphaerales bacterium]